MSLENKKTLLPGFTIQQIELIRRLRNSGLTKEQLVLAFDMFEQVDAELGNVYTVPASLAQQSTIVVAVCKPSEIKLSDSQANTRPSSQIIQYPANAQNYASIKLTQAASMSVSGQSNSGMASTTVPSTTQQSTTSRVMAGHVNRRFPTVKRSREEDMSLVIKLEPEDEYEGSSGGTVKPEASPYVSNWKEVDDFLKKGTEEMHEEIREFLYRHPAFEHIEIAQAAGVEVMNVSKFVVGNFQALPPQVLRRLCHWFLGAQRQQAISQQQRQQQRQQQQCTQQTSKILQGVLHDRLNGGNGSPHVDTSGDIKMGDTYPGFTEQEGLAVNFTPRRERFTFRKQHLEVLESYFKTNQYPTFEERGDIAQRCNDFMEAHSGRKLGEKERMTPQNVAYWFSNRRKDIKRMAREGGIEMSDVVLPSKVKTPAPPTPTFSMLDKDTAIMNCACPSETSTLKYPPVNVPSVGPVAFPSMVQQTGGETVLTTAVDTGSVRSDSPCGSLVVKMETADPSPLSAAGTNGPVSTSVSNGPSSTATVNGALSTAVGDGPVSTAVGDGPVSTAVGDGPVSTAVTDGLPSTAATNASSSTAVTNPSSSTAVTNTTVMAAVANGQGSVVDRIATVITSQLMSKSSDAALSSPAATSD